MESCSKDADGVNTATTLLGEGRLPTREASLHCDALSPQLGTHLLPTVEKWQEQTGHPGGLHRPMSPCRDVPPEHTAVRGVPIEAVFEYGGAGQVL